MDAIWNSVHRERAALIRDLRGLGPHDWDAESGCRRWRIRDVVAHLVDTAATTPTTFLTGMVRAGFDFDRQNELGVERYRDKQPDELISLLVQVRDRTSGPPRFMAPLATRLVEEIVHGEDIRRPLGLHREHQPEDLSDNGGAYRSHLWRDTCTELGIKHKRTRPYRPQTNGKIERFHRTLADGWAYARCYTSEAERRGELDSWLHYYNHHRPHTACGNQPPFSRLTNVPGQYS
mgnify:CR=1 FL=1